MKRSWDTELLVTISPMVIYKHLLLSTLVLRSITLRMGSLLANKLFQAVDVVQHCKSQEERPVACSCYFGWWRSIRSASYIVPIMLAESRPVVPVLSIHLSTFLMAASFIRSISLNGILRCFALLT